jgi:hypothetical protein
MRVVLGGATDATAIDLAGVPGVLSVEPTERAADARTYLLRIRPEEVAPVQRSVTRMAADTDLTVIHNDLVRVGLEDAFLRLVEPKERAA